MSEFHPLERVFFETVGQAYLEQAEPVDVSKVMGWRSRSAMPWLNRLHSTITGLRTRHRRIGDHQLTWLEAGPANAEPVVLIHGFGASKENWLAILPFLLRKYRVYVPDLPGWGESEFNANVSYCADDQVDRIAAWIESAVGKPVHLVGNSMGGGFASLVTARHPKWVKTVVLMNAAGIAGYERTPFEQGLAEGENSLVAHNWRGVYQLLSSVMQSRFRAALLTPLMGMDLVARRHVNEFMFRQLIGIAPSEDKPSLSSIKQPTLILWGSEDRVLHPTAAEVIAQIIPHAQTKIFYDVGHLPMVDKPRLTARHMRRFWLAHS